MSAIYEIHIGSGNGGGGPPPPTVVDHFAPHYIVGNTPAGDPATDQVGPFRYVHDDGDGIGLQTALAEAGAGVQGAAGWVHVRRGTYDLGQENIGALTVPPNIRVTGDGPGLTTIISQLQGNQGALIMSAGSSLEGATVQAPVAVDALGVVRGLISVIGDGVLLRRLSLASSPVLATALRSLISLVAGGGGTSRTLTIEDVNYAINGAVTTGDPSSAIEIVPGNGATRVIVSDLAGTGGGVPCFDPSVAGNGIAQLLGTRLRLTDWSFGGGRWAGVGVIDTLELSASAPTAGAVMFSIASRPAVPATVLRDVWLDPKGTVASGVVISADVNGGIGLAAEVDGVLHSGNGAFSAAIVSLPANASDSPVVRKVVATSGISANCSGVLIKGGCPDAVVTDCKFQMLGTNARTGISSSSPRTKAVKNTVVTTISGEGVGLAVCIAANGAQSIVEGNTIVTGNAVDVGIDLTGNTNGNVVGNVLDMNNDPNAFTNVPASCNVAQNVVV